MKKTKRKAFNFLRSYFDVFNKLQTDEDKLTFITAILNKQFLNEDPVDLKFPVDLAWDSQINAIDSSVKGWIRAEKTDLQGNRIDTPTTPPIDPSPQPLPKEEEEQEKEEEQVEEKVKEKTKEETTEKFCTWFNLSKKTHCGNEGKFKTLTQTDLNNLKKLKDVYSKDDFDNAFKAMTKSKWAKENNMITPAHFLVNNNFNRYLNTESTTNKNIVDLLKQK